METKTRAAFGPPSFCFVHQEVRVLTDAPDSLPIAATLLAVDHVSGDGPDGVVRAKIEQGRSVPGKCIDPAPRLPAVSTFPDAAGANGGVEPIARQQ